MMKTVSFVVPCYNSEAYMERCITSLLKAGEDTEIILINDGSTDRTGEIADHYKAMYPDRVVAIHKANGGHGSGVNAGLERAMGAYFKVVDSDDWLDEAALVCVMKVLREQMNKALPVDMLVCNYVYDHLLEGYTTKMDYANIFEENKVTTWSEMGHFHASQYLIMHSLLFRTEILRKAQVKLPEHTFYVDNIFANQPLWYVKSILYLNVDLYHYFLGREDQSVNEQVLMKRIDQQILVTRTLFSCSHLKEARKEQPKLEKYLVRNVSIMMSISSIHLLLIGDEEALEKRKALWEYAKAFDLRLYHRLRFRTLSGATYLPGRLGIKLTLWGYRMAQATYRFN